MGHLSLANLWNEVIGAIFMIALIVAVLVEHVIGPHDDDPD